MEENKDFIIKDRRVFGQEEGEEAEMEQASPRTETSPQDTPEAEETATSAEPDSQTQLPEVNFATFIMSLNVSALANLGAIEDPTTGKQSKNLQLGKQTIDILGMLEEKTRGNLTTDEENMLKSILYDLRMIYIKEKD